MTTAARPTTRKPSTPSSPRRRRSTRCWSGSPPSAPTTFETSPDEINWGHVGTLNHYRAKLREITDMAFSEGEHAE